MDAIMKNEINMKKLSSLMNEMLSCSVNHGISILSLSLSSPTQFKYDKPMTVQTMCMIILS